MEILPGEKQPYLFAHRGCSKDAPENTLAAFELARQRGIPGIELDIHLCKSGELIVTHDDNLRRVTGADIAVEEAFYADIRNLDAGKWKDEKFAGEKLPLLQDVFDLLGGSVYYDIEIKSRKTSETGIEQLLFSMLKQYGLEERCIVSSFNPIPVRTFKEKAPHIPTAIIYSVDQEVPWYLRHGEGRWIAGADILKPNYTKVNSGFNFVNLLTGRRPVLPWTVDDPETAAHLLKSGASGIISNTPETLLQVTASGKI